MWPFISWQEKKNLCSIKSSYLFSNFKLGMMAYTLTPASIRKLRKEDSEFMSVCLSQAIYSKLQTSLA